MRRQRGGLTARVVIIIITPTAAAIDGLGGYTTITSLGGYIATPDSTTLKANIIEGNIAMRMVGW